MISKKNLGLLSLIILSSNFASSAAPGNGAVVSYENTNSRDKISEWTYSKFEKKWIDSVCKTIEISNEQNKLNVRESKKNTFKSSPGYFYSLINSKDSPIDDGGGAIYCEGYRSFDDFKIDVFKSILRHFLSNRAKYLCKYMTKDSLKEREELADIIDVLTDNSFDLIISKYNDLNNLELTLIN